MSEGNIEVARRVFAHLKLVALGGSVGPEELEAQLTDAALEKLYDPEVEWVPVSQGLLAGDSYVGYEGLRRFSADFVSVWDEFVADPQEFRDVGKDRIVVTMRVRGRINELEVDEVWSAIWTLRNGRIVKTQTYTSEDGALEAAGLSE
jgi:ketosteroid isomerase-like protein